MLKKALAVVGVLILLAVPLVGRWLYHYQGRYQPSQVPHPDLASVKAPTPELSAFVDQPASSTAEAGAIVVDLAHDNRVSMAELNVLQARLASVRHYKIVDRTPEASETSLLDLMPEGRSTAATVADLSRRLPPGCYYRYVELVP